MNKRLLIILLSIVIAIPLVWGLSLFVWSPLSAYAFYLLLVIFFLGILVSNQQYEEDVYSKVERLISAFLFSYLVFFRFFYAPISQFIFGSLVTKDSFPADLLSLVLFAIFFVLFGTVFLVINTYAKVGFLSEWRFFNNDKAFFFLRCLFLTAVLVFLAFYIRNSFFSIQNSAPINRILSARSCNWAYIRYPNFLSLGRSVTGRDVCIYNYSQDKYDPKYCDLILDDEMTKEFCTTYFLTNQ